MKQQLDVEHSIARINSIGCKWLPVRHLHADMKSFREVKALPLPDVCQGMSAATQVIAQQDDRGR